MRKISTFLFISICFFSSFAQNPLAKQWDQRFGGSSYDIVTAFRTTFDGGYIFGGYSESGLNGDKTQSSWGGTDFWVVKTDATGNKIWDKRFGGTAYETLYDITETSNGKFILAGTSNSGINGDKTQASWSAYSDFWILKIDELGNKIWDKRYGGTLDDYVSAVREAPDGGFLLAGYSNSGVNGDKTVAAWSSSNDFWVVKIDSAGNKLWDNRYGGTSNEYLTCMDITSDGGFILGGWSGSGISGDKTESSRGYDDYWVVKIDSLGVKQWDKRFGGTQGEEMHAVNQTSEGGYILGGSSGSAINGDKTENSRGIWDYWIVKTDASGTKLWDKRFGGAGWDDYVHTAVQTTDGGYFLAGRSDSPLSGDKTESNMGLKQAWAVKTDASGIKVWDKTITTNGYDRGAYGALVGESCYAFAIETDGGIGGYKSQTGWGSDDYWIIEFCDTSVVILPIELTSFIALPENVSIGITWTTATETNNMTFELQRGSQSPDDFKTIFTTEGQGNSFQSNYYSFSDRDIETGIIYYYRLKQTDYDGTATYSAVISGEIEGNEPTITLSPNPFHETLDIGYEIQDRSDVSIQVFNYLGLKIMEVKIEDQNPGKYHYPLNATENNITPGSYILKLQAGDQHYSQKIKVL